MQDITWRDWVIYNNKLLMVRLNSKKYIPKTKYLISWRSLYPQMHSLTCLELWSANFPIYILKCQSKETKRSSEHNAFNCNVLSLQLWRRIGNHTGGYYQLYYQYSDVQWKDSPVCYIPHGLKTVITAFEAVFFQNGSIYERECPWRLIGTRGPVNQTWSGGCPS